MPESKFIRNPRIGVVGEASGPKVFTGKFADLGSLFEHSKTKSYNSNHSALSFVSENTVRILNLGHQ